VISNLPLVRVPVLSNTIQLIVLAIYKLSIFLIKIPFYEPTPIPTVIAVGVARPIPHGHATTNTVTKFLSAL